jgi:hypothetical protein
MPSFVDMAKEEVEGGLSGPALAEEVDIFVFEALMIVSEVPVA